MKQLNIVIEIDEIWSETKISLIKLLADSQLLTEQEMKKYNSLMAISSYWLYLEKINELFDECEYIKNNTKEVEI
jgi:F0F1-type ATP synthase delta subunit